MTNVQTLTLVSAGSGLRGDTPAHYASIDEQGAATALTFEQAEQAFADGAEISQPHPVYPDDFASWNGAALQSHPFQCPACKGSGMHQDAPGHACDECDGVGSEPAPSVGRVAIKAVALLAAARHSGTHRPQWVSELLRSGPWHRGNVDEWGELCESALEDVADGADDDGERAASEWVDTKSGSISTEELLMWAAKAPTERVAVSDEAAAMHGTLGGIAERLRSGYASELEELTSDLLAKLSDAADAFADGGSGPDADDASELI